MTTVFSWREAIKKSQLPATTRHVLLNLSTRMNDDGTNCFPSIATQSEETGLSAKTIIDHIALAEKEGFLTKSKKGIPGRQWKRNDYVPTFPLQFDLIRPSDVERGGEPNGSFSTRGGEPNGVGVVKEVHTTSSLTSSVIIKENIKRKTKKVNLDTWEKQAGSPLCIQQMQKWISTEELCPVLVASMIKEFRDSVRAGDNHYANFVLAFRVWVVRGYLSKKLPQLLLKNSPHKPGNQVRYTGGVSI